MLNYTIAFRSDGLPDTLQEERRRDDVALHRLIDELERDDAVLDADNVRERADALDRLDRLFPMEAAECQTVAAQRAAPWRAALERADAQLHAALRETIRRGDGARRLLALMRSDAASAGDRYDYRDALLSGVLQIDEPAAVGELADEMVFYQPTPARHILTLIDRAPIAPDDVLIDLGSGLGHVPLLAAICTGARCIGIEREAAYVDCARRCVQALNLSGVTFVHDDVRAADLSAGTVFYLYTPFTGAMLDAVLGQLHALSRRRERRIVTLGPCTPTVARQNWLVTDDPVVTDAPVLFRSVTPGSGYRAPPDAL